MRELRGIGRLHGNAVTPLYPLDASRFSHVLAHTHRCQLRKQQDDHDKLLLEEQVLQQKRTSGSLAHTTTADKRNLDKLIRSTRKSRHRVIENMKEHVDYLTTVPTETPIPNNWVDLAKEGQPFWLSNLPAPEGRPSQHEINAIVESYLKRARAWEQLTMIVPREVHDALEHFSLLELQANVCERDLTNRLWEHQVGSGSFAIFSQIEVDKLLGTIILAKDLISSVETARRQCAVAWGCISQLVNESGPSLVIASGSRFPIDGIAPFIAAELIPPSMQLLQGSLATYDATAEGTSESGDTGQQPSTLDSE